MRLSLAALFVAAAFVRADDWPQWLGPKRDGVWREDGLVDKFPPGGPPVRWRAKIGAGYAGPAVAGNRVYVSDRLLKEGARNPSSAFARANTPGVERVVCLDNADGHVVWQREFDCHYRISYPSGPRATPLVADGKVYVLGAMGDLRCLDATTGATVWHHNLPKEYDAPVPIWGFASHPLLDGDKLITLVGGDGSVVVAFHKDTGKELWRKLSAYSVGYAPTVIAIAGGTRQLIVWDAEAVHGLNPDTGDAYWSVPFHMKEPPALSIPTPRIDGNRLLLTSFYDSALMLQLDPAKPSASVVWRGKSSSERPDRTDTLHSIMPTPYFHGSHIYGVCSYGQLRCLEAATGKRVWETMAATRERLDGAMKPENPKPRADDRWGNAFLVPQGDRTVLFNEHGDLILARLTSAGYDEIDRARVIDADDPMPGRKVVWSHPAFAHRSAYVRNNTEIVCVSLAK